MLRLVIISVVLVFLFHSVAMAQEQKQESGKGASNRYLKFKSSDSDQAAQLLREAVALKQTNPGEALNKVEEALGISIARKDALNEGKCYLLIGEINQDIEEWQLAFDNFKTAYDKLKNNHNKTGEFVSALKGLGYNSMKLRQYESALRFYDEVLAMKEYHDDAETKLAIAEVQYQKGDYAAATSVLSSIQVPKSNKKIVPSTGDSQLTTAIQNLEARILAKQNALENSTSTLDQSIKDVDEGQNATPTQAQAIQETKEELSDALRGQQRYTEDVDLRNKSITFNTNQKNLEGVAKDKVALSKSLADLGETNAALNELKEAARIADTIDNAEAKAEAYLALANFYETNGDEKKALISYRVYSEAVRSDKTRQDVASAQKEELLKKQREIESLSKEVSISQQQERYEQATVERQRLVIYGLILIILIIATTSYFIYKNAVASKVANQLLALKSLRSQMNPHFIFNALNSVNHFIAQQDERTANKFLSEFSQLMRLVMENSQEDFIPLHTEQDILALYLKLEHYRFRDKFDYAIEVDDNINVDAIEVPPMLIQPYIENAVWHGLRYKETKGNLVLRFEQRGANLFVEIQDDGIGRKKSAALKTSNQKKHNSTGLKNIQERLKILNTVYRTKYSVDIQDLEDGKGTLVRICLPINHPKKSSV